MAEVVGERIARRMADLGLTQSAVARAIGVKQPSIGRLISGETRQTRHIIELSQALHTTPAYLTGEDDEPGEVVTQDPRQSFGASPMQSVQKITADLGLVPVREIDLSLGMGATYLDVPVTETVRLFPIEWLRLYTKADPEHLLFAQGVGDSMEPTLRDSDLMLIDCSQKHLNMSDKVWAIAYADCGAVKRLRPVPGGGVEILSDNPNVPTATAYDGELHILGRVVATVRKM